MGRAPCCDKNGLKKGPWTPEEDQKLVDYIQKHGHGSWRTLPKNAGLQRCGKSCRLRWINYLRPDIKRGRFSFEEEETIIQLHSILGNKWSAVAAHLPGRTDNEIKNYWNTQIRKRLLRMGIDPVTHTPRTDLLDLSSLLNSSLYNSSQSNISRLLGMQNMVNTDSVLRLATSLLSSQHENPDSILQNLRQNQLCNPQFQFQFPFPFPLLQCNQLQNPNQEIQACTTSSTLCAQFLDETQLMQLDLDQFQSNYSNSQPNVLPGNLATTSDYVPILNYGYPCSNDQSLGNPLTEKSNFHSNENSIQNFNLPSLLSTTSSSPTPLNSPLTNINSSTEDERDTNCSGVFPFELQHIFDVNEFI